MLQQPFHNFFPITQHFGENLNAFYKNEGLLGHQGVDIAMPTGTPIISPCSGVVSAVSVDIQKGEGVSVISDDIFQWNGQDCKLICVMWHMKDQSIVVKVGDKVSTGQLLGLSNNTGQSTGPHLHFSTIPITTDGSRRSLAGRNNGYEGCVDPLPFLNLTPAPINVPMVSFSHTWNVPVQRVKDFQTKNGLVADGAVGPKTQAVIEKLIG